MSAKHTEGPWACRCESVGDMWWIVTDSAGGIVANVNFETGPDIPPMVSRKMPTEANARLIASAPDLLAACEESVTEPGALAYRSHAYAIKRLEAINASVQSAILKAKGQGVGQPVASAPAVTREELARCVWLRATLEREEVDDADTRWRDVRRMEQSILTRLSAEGGGK